MFVYLINKKEIDTFVLPGCERHVKAWLGGLKPRYPKQNHDYELGGQTEKKNLIVKV